MGAGVAGSGAVGDGVGSAAGVDAGSASAAAVDAEVAATLETLRPELTRLVHELYDEPEIGFAEHRSVARIAALLAAHGVDVGVGAFGLETAFRASGHEASGAGSSADVAESEASGPEASESQASGPHFAIIAEYDALPGIGHACGHNIIAGVAVGAFLAAAPIVASLGGRLSLIGTPAEENGGGKELIIRAGGFDDVDAAGMVHPGAGSGTGSVLGQRTTGVRRVAVTYHGRAAHAAGAPWLGRNALDGVVTAYQGVAQLRQHILPTDRIHGIITDGGAAPNIVPERAAALFYVRSADVDGLRDLTERVVAVLEGAARITGTRAEIDVVEMYVPFSWFEPMWLENLGFAEPGEGWKMTEAGVTALDGDLPVNMSGGVLCTNPIGASGMLRFGEAAMQVRGTAGEHQVDSVRKAVGHAYGGGSQFFAMWVVGKDKP